MGSSFSVYIVAELPELKYFLSRVKYLSGVVPGGMKYSNLKLIDTCITPFIEQMIITNQIVRIDIRP